MPSITNLYFSYHAERAYKNVINTKEWGNPRPCFSRTMIDRCNLNILYHANNEYIFASPVKVGEPIKEIKKAFKNALQKAGIEDFRFHDLRHTFASHYQMETNDQRGLGELLGHRTFDMTKRYTHLSLKYKKDGVDALCRRLCGTAT